MVRCSELCEPICDFCMYGAGIVATKDGRRAFNGNIWCRVYKQFKAPEEICDYAHCFRAVDELPLFPELAVNTKYCPEWEGLDPDAITDKDIMAMPDYYYEGCE